MADDTTATSDASSTPSSTTTTTTATAAATPTYATEAALRTAVVGYLTQAQDAITAGTSLFQKTLPQDLYQLQISLGLRIKNLPITSS